MDISVNIHMDAEGTEISRHLPDAIIPGGLITIKGVDYPNVSIFGPENPIHAASFWTYLSNVASDMALYCEQRGKR